MDLTESVVTTPGHDEATIHRAGAPLLRGRVVDTSDGLHLDVLRFDGQGWVVLRSVVRPAESGAYLSFGVDDAGAAYVAETVPRPCPAHEDCVAAADDIHVWRFDGTTLVDAVPAAAAPPATTCPADLVVTGEPARLARSFAVPTGGQAFGPPIAVRGVRRVDRWRLDLSDASELDEVVQVEWAAGQGEPGTTYAGQRATWIFRPIDPGRWCLLGPLAVGWEGHEDLGGPSVDVRYPVFAATAGVVPGRAALVVRATLEGTGNGGGGGQEVIAVAQVHGFTLAIDTVPGSSHWGSAGEIGRERAAWAPLGDAIVRTGDQEGTLYRDGAEIRYAEHALRADRFDGARYVPWLQPIPPSPER